MKQKILFLTVGILIFTFYSCDSEVTRVEDTKMMANIDVMLIDSYHDSTLTDQIQLLSFWGTLITNPISSLKYVLIDSDTVEVSQQPDLNNRGIISFRSPFNSKILNINPRTFKLITDLGYLEGLLSFPDSISSVQFNYTDTLRISDTLKIIFNGNGDYYIAGISMSWGSEYYKSIRLVSKERQFIIDSTFFENEGRLYIDYIYSYRGPYPEVGSNGNMYGDGKGFLYCIRPKSISKLFFIVK